MVVKAVVDSDKHFRMGIQKVYDLLVPPFVVFIHFQELRNDESLKRIGEVFWCHGLGPVRWVG